MAHMGTLSQESNVSTKEACMDLCLGNSECKSFRYDAFTQEIGIFNFLEFVLSTLTESCNTSINFVVKKNKADKKKCDLRRGPSALSYLLNDSDYSTGLKCDHSFEPSPAHGKYPAAPGKTQVILQREVP